MSEVVLSLFDPVKGPTAVFSTIDELSARKVALKSQLTLSINTSASLDENTDAVIPFPDLEKTGYIFLFKIPSQDMIGSLSFLLDDDKNLELYKNISLLRYEAEDLIRRYLNTSDLFNLTKELMNYMTQWGQSLENTTITFEEELVKRKITISHSSIEPSISFLFDTTKNDKDLAIVLTSLLQENTVFIICSNTGLRDITISSLEAFTPHKTLRKISYTKDPVNPEDADLIVIDPNLEKFYRDYIILNVDKKKVSKGHASKFVLDILNQVKGKSNTEATYVIRQKVEWLLDKVSQLTELFVNSDRLNGNNGDQKKVLVDKISVEAPEALDIIVEIASSVNPLIKTVIRNEISQWKEKSLDFFKQGW